MHIQFVGAVSGTLTGSCTWLYHKKSDTQFLVDCGMFQGESYSDFDNKKKFPFIASQLKYVLLTHAHLDHCGLIPKLYKQGFKGQVITTEATAELAKLIMFDSAKILNSNGNKHQGKKQKKEKNNSIYTVNDVKKVDFLCIDKNDNFTNKAYKIGHEISVTFLRNSHILGASSIQITWESNNERKSILFSGDIGCNFDNQEYLPLLKPNHLPHTSTNYLVIESTYGNRERDERYKNRANRLGALTKALENTTMKKGGKLIVPAFSLQRTQEIIFDLFTMFSFFENHERLAEVEFTTYCYSHLAQKVNYIFSKELVKVNERTGKYKYLNNSAKKILESTKMTIGDIFSETLSINEHTFVQQPKYKAGDLDSCNIIVASSGMCDAGPINEILKNTIEDEKNTILLTGYVSPQSLGGRLKEVSANDNKVITIADKEYHLRAEIIDLSSFYSAHADVTQLLDYIFYIGEDYYHPNKVKDITLFINHGNEDAKKSFKTAIEKRSSKETYGERKVQDIIIAEKSDWFNLEKGCYDPQFSIRGNNTNNLLPYMQKIIENQEEIKKDIKLIKAKLQIEEEIKSTPPVFKLLK